MCLILVAWRHHPEFPLVVAANRDEYFGRPTAAVAFWENHPQVSGERHELAPGIYGLSNAWLDTPWPKVGAGKTALEAALTHLPDEQRLWVLLRDDRPHPDDTLPATGIPLEWERLLSAAFVRAPNYGTRSSTVLTFSAGGIATFDEQSWLPGGITGERRRFRFRLTQSSRYGLFPGFAG